MEKNTRSCFYRHPDRPVHASFPSYMSMSRQVHSHFARYSFDSSSVRVFSPLWLTIKPATGSIANRVSTWNICCATCFHKCYNSCSVTCKNLQLKPEYFDLHPSSFADYACKAVRSTSFRLSSSLFQRLEILDTR